MTGPAGKVIGKLVLAVVVVVAAACGGGTAKRNCTPPDVSGYQRCEAPAGKKNCYSKPEWRSVSCEDTEQ